MPWPKPVFPSVHPAKLGNARGRIPLSLRIWIKMSASSYPHLFIASDVRSSTKVDLISDPACRHLRAISGKFLPNLPTFCDEEAHCSTPFRTILLPEGIYAKLQKKLLLLSNQGDIGIIKMRICFQIYHFHEDDVLKFYSHWGFWIVFFF